MDAPIVFKCGEANQEYVEIYRYVYMAMFICSYTSSVFEALSLLLERGLCIQPFFSTSSK